MQEVFSKDPFVGFYNLGTELTWSLTTDIDWAPEYAIESLLSLIEGFGIPVTAFATHDSHLLKSAPDWVEIGLHPDNTRPDPRYGLARKLSTLKEIYPESIGMRAHRNFFGQNIAHYAREAGLVYDVSVLNWCRPFGQVFQDQYGLYRMSYNWEDGVHADMGLDWDLKHLPIEQPGLKIFNCHPIFIYLNAPDDDYRRAIVRDYPNLQDAPEAALKSAIYPGYGAREFLLDLLRTLKSRNASAYTLSQMIRAATQEGIR